MDIFSEINEEKMNNKRNKLVFIINSAQNQRCIKRVNEFVSQGYDVEAYAFTRGDDLRNKPNFDLHIIGRLNNDTSYRKRLKLMYNAIRGVLYEHKDKDVIYYLFSLDVAFLYSLLNKNKCKYIYEESDLVHTYIRNKLLKEILAKIDKRIINISLLTVFTSEGFVNYHFNGNHPANTIVVPNRLTPEILSIPKVEKNKLDVKKIRFGFVGAVRFKSLYCLSETILKNYPSHEFHFYGTINSNRDGDFNKLKEYPNCFLHGGFKNPIDLPVIYSNIDVLISTYDLIEENVKYAEPNKLYESIYFETPIVVTTGTYLAEKVSKLGIGYDVDAMKENSVVSFVNSLTINSLQEKINNCRKIDKANTLNVNNELFDKIRLLNII